MRPRPTRSWTDSSLYGARVIGLASNSSRQCSASLRATAFSQSWSLRSKRTKSSTTAALDAVQPVMDQNTTAPSAWGQTTARRKVPPRENAHSVHFGRVLLPRELVVQLGEQFHLRGTRSSGAVSIRQYGHVENRPKSDQALTCSGRPLDALISASCSSWRVRSGPQYQHTSKHIIDTSRAAAVVSQRPLVTNSITFAPLFRGAHGSFRGSPRGERA